MLKFGTLAGGGPAEILAAGASFAFVVLETGAVKIPQQTVARGFVLTRVGFAWVRAPLALDLQRDERQDEYKRPAEGKGRQKRKP